MLDDHGNTGDSPTPPDRPSQGSFTGASDVILLERWLRSRDGHAMQAILDRHHASLVAVIRRALGPLAETHLLDDALTQTQLTLFEQAASIADPRSVGGWLRVVATNQARRLRREHLRDDPKQLPLAAGLATPAQPQIHDEVLERARHLLDLAIADLSPAQQDVVRRVIASGDSWQQVGEDCGISAEAARKRYSYALSQLRSWYRRRGLPLSVLALAALLGPRAPAVEKTSTALAAGVTALIVVGLMVVLAVSRSATPNHTVANSTAVVQPPPVALQPNPTITNAPIPVAIVPSTIAVPVQPHFRQLMTKPNREYHLAGDLILAKSTILDERRQFLTVKGKRGYYDEPLFELDENDQEHEIPLPNGRLDEIRPIAQGERCQELFRIAFLSSPENNTTPSAMMMWAIGMQDGPVTLGMTTRHKNAWWWLPLPNAPVGEKFQYMFGSPCVAFSRSAFRLPSAGDLATPGVQRSADYETEVQKELEGLWTDLKGTRPIAQAWPDLAQALRRLDSPKGSPTDRVRISAFHQDEIFAGRIVLSSHSPRESAAVWRWATGRLDVFSLGDRSKDRRLISTIISADGLICCNLTVKLDQEGASPAVSDGGKPQPRAAVAWILDRVGLPKEIPGNVIAMCRVGTGWCALTGPLTNLPNQVSEFVWRWQDGRVRRLIEVMPSLSPHEEILVFGARPKDSSMLFKRKDQTWWLATPGD